MGEYPLQRRFFVWGLWAAILAGLLFQSPLVGFAVFVLFVVVGALWRRDEMPILAFLLAYHWLFVISGYLYREVTGILPAHEIVGDLEGAIFLSLIGFLALAAGIRTGFHLLRQRVALAERRLETSTARYKVRSLFWLVIAVYTSNWFFEILPKAIFFDAAEIIGNFFNFRDVLLLSLFLVIVRQRQGYKYGVGALLYVLIPALTNPHAAFSYILSIPLLALLREWHPWSKSISDRRRSYRIAGVVTGVAVAIFAMGIIWEGAVKPIWRPMYLSGEVVGTPTEKVEMFVSILEEEVPGMDWSRGLETIIGRMSGVVYFSLVLDRVPAVVPHTDGRLTLRALKHITSPRVLFPEKENLISSSWLIIEYAGLLAAGEEERASIGLGYMPELYIDFGHIGMFMALFLYGLFLGLLYGGMFLLSPSHYFSNGAVAVMFFIAFTNYDGEFAKQLGALVMTFIVFGILLKFVGPRLHRMCAERRRTGLGPVASSMRSREATNNGVALTDF